MWQHTIKATDPTVDSPLTEKQTLIEGPERKLPRAV